MSFFFKRVPSKKKSKNEEVDRVNIRRVHTRRGNMKSVKIRRKRNEKHKVENEEDYKRKEI